jgi:hypothetical protein
MNLAYRLDRITQLIDEENDRVQARDGFWGPTGFVPCPPCSIAESVVALKEERAHGTSLELGCGTAAWTLMMAAAGYDAYAVEMNPMLLQSASTTYQRCISEGLIPPEAICRFVEGNMFPPAWRMRYEQYRNEVREEELRQRGFSSRRNAEILKDLQLMMPEVGAQHDVYEGLGVTLATADIVYSYPWPKQERFIFEFLREATKSNAILAIAGVETDREWQLRRYCETGDPLPPAVKQIAGSLILLGERMPEEELLPEIRKPTSYREYDSQGPFVDYPIQAAAQEDPTTEWCNELERSRLAALAAISQPLASSFSPGKKHAPKKRKTLFDKIRDLF